MEIFPPLLYFLIIIWDSIYTIFNHKWMGFTNESVFIEFNFQKAIDCVIEIERKSRRSIGSRA